MKTRSIMRPLAALAAAAALVMSGGVAYADNVQNDVETGGSVAVTAGSTATVNFRVRPNNGDGDAGCNIDGDESMTASITGTPADVATLSAPSVTFTDCDVWVPVTVTGVSAGTAEFTLAVQASDTGGTYNFSPAAFTVNVTAAAKAATTTTVICPVSVTYTGAPLEPCTATVTDGTDWTGAATLSYADNVNAGTATVTASFAGDATHLPSSDTATFTIGKAASATTVVCDPDTITYDGTAHSPCSATATLAGGTQQTLAVTYTGDQINVGSVSATAGYAGDSNHFASQGSATFTILPAAPVCTINGYTGVYDGAAHGATGSCTAVTGGTLPGLDLGVAYTDVPGGTAYWSLPASQNHTAASGSVAIQISQAAATCVVTGGSYVYDGQPHSPTGTCTGVLGEDLSAGLTFGSVTNVPGGSVPWAFEGGTNYADQNGTASVTIEAWTLGGFYQPVRMSSETTLVWNTVKGGSTVPLKFEVFAGSTELTNTDAISSFTARQVNCDIPTSIEDTVDFTTTGATVLRYDTTDGRFIQNWQTPKKTGCFVATMETDDGSTIAAYFKLK